MSKGYKVWFHNNAVCEKAIVEREDYEAVLTGYGENDFWIEFLVGSGLWETMVGMEPTELRKRNGKPPRVLNGIEVIRELAEIKAISHCGKVLSDARLMLIAGFNVEEVKVAQERRKLVIDPETLSNHLGRIGIESVQRSFVEHVRLLRERRWIRGKVYAADATEIIIPYGQKYEHLGQVGNKRGYKLVLLLNITPGRERIVGFSLGSLQKSEKTMLREMLEKLNQEIAPLSEWMDVLVMDRGYWGVKYLTGLKEDFGIDYVRRARDEGLEVVRYIQDCLVGGDVKWMWGIEEHSQFGKIKVRCAGIEGIPLYDENGKQIGWTNAVIAEESNLNGKPLKNEDGSIRGPYYYITSLPTIKNPMRIRRYYRSRWIIENQGFRELNQRWGIERLAGRKFNLINARIGFALMLYNAEHIMKMRHSGAWEDQRYKLSGKWDSRLGGLSIVIYTNEGGLGLFTTRQYRDLVAKSERNRMVDILKSAVAQGQTIEEVLALLHPKDNR